MRGSNDPNATRDETTLNPGGNGIQSAFSGARNNSSNNLVGFGRQSASASPALGNRGDTPIIDFGDWSEDPFTDVKESDVFAPFEEDQEGGVNGNGLATINGTVPALSNAPTFPAAGLLVAHPATVPLQPQQQVEATRKRSAPEPALALSISAPSASPSSTRSTISRRKKKPKGMPKRPLSAYNLYFQAERSRIIEEQAKQGEEGPKIGFEGLGKIIGKQWKNLSNADRKKYELLAEKDGERYRKEMDAYNDLKSKRLEEQESRPLTSTPQFASARLFEMGPPLQQPALQNASFTNSLLASGGAYLYAPTLQGIHHPSSIPPSPFASKPPPGQATQGRVFYSRERAASGEGTLASSPSPALSYDGRGTPSVPPHQSPAQTPRPIVSMGLQHEQHSQQQPLPSMGGMPEHASVQNSFPLPPGMEIVLCDSTGVDRKYKVQYTCYAMTREAAHQYLESITAGNCNSGTSAASASMYRENAAAPADAASASTHMHPPPAQGHQQPAPQAIGPPLHHYGAPWGC